MHEIELKFQVPAGALAAVRRAVSTSTAQTTRLQAHYFDTPDRRLAAAGLALRLRKEGRRWVQTLKGRGDGLMQRLEHEVDRGAQASMPSVDLRLHTGTPAGAALTAALAPPKDAAGAGTRAAPHTDADTGLVALYATDIRRLHRVLRSGGALIEIALDVGRISARAPDVAPASHRAVCEVEFELKRGPPQALLALAARWVERHGLWLDVRSKAEIGHRLAAGWPGVPAVRATKLSLKPAGNEGSPGRRGPTADAALRAMVRNSLTQVLGNACELADGIDSPEHIHQLRVGLRRLRTALREFGHAAPDVDPQWGEQLAEVFARLGSARDRDALSASVLPALARAGAPEISLPTAEAAQALLPVLRGAAFNRLLLALIGFVTVPAAVGGEPAAAPPARGDGAGGGSTAAVQPAPPPRLQDLAPQPLQRLWHQATRDAKRYAQLSEDDQHRARKQLKRLRYASEFVASLYRAKAVERFLDALRPAQDALGDYHDLIIARDAFQARVAVDPRAWFALGWLAAQRDPALARCEKTLKVLARVKPFWH